MWQNLRVAGVWTIALVCLVGASCSDHPTKTPGGTVPMKSPYAQAKVEVYSDDKGNPVNLTMRINDQDEIQHLLKFFPALETKARRETPSGWKYRILITLLKHDGSSVTVKSNYKVWSKDQVGDWPVQEGLSDYISSLGEKTP